MRHLWSRTLTWWDAMSPHQRRTVNALALCVVAYIAHYLVFTVSQPFYIEDAGITFAYARNLAEGHGLVTYIGGERVEGYSNPLWTFLIALFHLVKISPWVSSKLLGALFGAATLPLVWAITRRARGGQDDLINVVPPFLLAASTQFVLWNSSGLENSLFCLLLAAGMFLTVREGEDGGRPWSALAWFGLAITRPEGPMYAALAFAALVVFHAHRALSGGDGSLGRRLLRGFLLPTVAWIAAFGIPFALYHWWRYSYFAWPYPETYYAKLGEDNRFKPFSWDVRGWSYLRKYMHTYWIAWVSPLFFFATAGLKKKRGLIGLILLALFGLVVLWDGKGWFFDTWEQWAPARRKWMYVRCWSIYGGVAVLALLTLGRSGWKALSLTWATFCAAVFFTLYTGGDWMDAFRFANLWAVPQFILLGLGLGALVDRLPGLTWRPCRCSPILRTIAVAAAALAMAAPNIMGSYEFVLNPETGVRDVNRRVQYMTWVQERLHIDHVTLLDVDMGAHMWFSGWRIMDVAGLVDIRMGHHRYEKDFLREYIFEELQPTYIHSHGGWSRKTKINNFPEFKRAYTEIPGYPAGRRAFHMGNHVARKYMAIQEYPGPEGREAAFDGGVSLAGWDLPSPEVPVEGKFFLRTWWRAPGREAGFRILVFVKDAEGHIAVQEQGPAYDFLQPKSWHDDDLLLGHYDVALPEGLPQGDYQIGLVVLDEEDGTVLAWQRDGAAAAGPNDPGFDPGAPAPEAGPTPLYMRGELLLSEPLHVVPRKAAQEQAEEDVDRALHLAATGACEEAWEAWLDATRHLIRNTRWQHENVGQVNEVVARCHVDRAVVIEDAVARATALEQAAVYAPELPALVAAARPLAAKLMEQGERQYAKQEWEGCYTSFDKAARIDPRQSFARRKAEECRDWKLDIPGVDRPVENKPKARPAKKDRKPAPRKARTAEEGPPDEGQPEVDGPDAAPPDAEPPTPALPERKLQLDPAHGPGHRLRPFGTPEPIDGVPRAEEQGDDEGAAVLPED
ncbi:MAG: hypothetical protein ABIO70_32320 [Pseudomonadota bacterium]